MNTEVYIAWAMHSTMDANSGSQTLGPVHTSRGVSADKQNLIAMAMMMPSTSVVSTTQTSGNYDRC